MTDMHLNKFDQNQFGGRGKQKIEKNYSPFAASATAAAITSAQITLNMYSTRHNHFNIEFNETEPIFFFINFLYLKNTFFCCFSFFSFFFLGYFN